MNTAKCYSTLGWLNSLSRPHRWITYIIMYWPELAGVWLLWLCYPDQGHTTGVTPYEPDPNVKPRTVHTSAIQYNPCTGNKMKRCGVGLVKRRPRYMWAILKPGKCLGTRRDLVASPNASPTHANLTPKICQPGAYNRYLFTRLPTPSAVLGPTID